MKRIVWSIILLFISPLVFSQSSEHLDEIHHTILDMRHDLEAQQARVEKLSRSVNSLSGADSTTAISLQKQLSEAQKNLNFKLNILHTYEDSIRTLKYGFPVVLGSDTLLEIFGMEASIIQRDRSQRLSTTLLELENIGILNYESISLDSTGGNYIILHGSNELISVISRDAFWNNRSKKAVAEQWYTKIYEGVKKRNEETSTGVKVKRFGFLALVIIVLLVMITLLNKGFTFLNKQIIRRFRHYLRGVRIKNYELLSAQQEVLIVRNVMRGIKWIIIATLVYITLPIVLGIFPTTRGIADTLLGFVISPVKGFFKGLIGFIPNLISIILIVFVTRYITRLLRFFTEEIHSGKLKLSGFYPEWAYPTATLVRIIIYAFAGVLLFPLIPGSDSAAFKGVGVFLGILVSLGSSSAIGNLIAGLVITYMRPFKVGDRVKIGDVEGDVVEKTILITRLRSLSNEIVTIPNSSILNGTTINYSSEAEKQGLLVGSDVSLGYDVPRNKVSELLIAAATKTEGFSQRGKPFVLQKSLDDFYVSYRVVGAIVEPTKKVRILSDLNGNILDAFNEAGIEILSPHFRTMHDGSEVYIPKGEVKVEVEGSKETSSEQNEKKDLKDES